MAIRFYSFLVAACIGGRASAASPDPPLFEEIRVSDRILVLQHAPWLETMTVVDAGPGLVVVDTWGSLAAAKSARSRIDGIFHKPVLFVINTHHHWDHTFGNAAFEDAEIVGHRFCVEDMIQAYGDSTVRKEALDRSAALAEQETVRRYILNASREAATDDFYILPPNRVCGDRDTIHVGAPDGAHLIVRLYHTPGIHTRSNLTIFMPELGVVFGRREFAGSGPIRLEPDADPAILIQVLEEILESGNPVRTLIPGHGSPIENPDLRGAVERLKEIQFK
jgi:glyoxylase-like metal-dependent hydrolase (beta-lactamase superfamily II)